jgi:DNA-binding CsgD family transcriptional regulator
MISASDIARYGFTRQELRVCHLVADSKPSADIAAVLVVEIPAVYKLEKRIRDKVEASDRTDAIKRLRELGFWPVTKFQIGYCATELVRVRLSQAQKSGGNR